MLRINKQGFTLIELMVVIVIIGVLASLAIPRFTEASVKAKVAEAPRVIASFESAYLAAVAEGAGITKIEDLIFESPAKGDSTGGAGSKWFEYDGSQVTSITAATYTATAKEGIGGGLKGKTLETVYASDSSGGGGTFTHGGTLERKYVPNFKDN